VRAAIPRRGWLTPAVARGADRGWRQTGKAVLALVPALCAGAVVCLVGAAALGRYVDGRCLSDIESSLFPPSVTCQRYPMTTQDELDQGVTVIVGGSILLAVAAAAIVFLIVWRMQAPTPPHV
jgi:hypothetical protein